MSVWRQTIAALALASASASQAILGQGVTVGGFETHGSVGLDRAEYQALGLALTTLLTEQLGDRGASGVVRAPNPTGRAGRVDLGAARTAAAASGAKLLVVGSLLDQYGDIQVEARLIDATTGKPITVVRADATLVKREQLAEAIASLANQLTEQPGVGGRPRAAEAGIPLPALVQFGKGLEAEAAGDRAAAQTAFRAAVHAAPGFTSATRALQRVGG